MKIEKFLNWIKEQMISYPDINFTTLKLFIDKFYDCLSITEMKRWNIEINIIREFTLKQLSIDETVHRIKTKNLEHQLIEIKNNEVKPK